MSVLWKFNNKKGILTIEILIVVAIIAVTLTSLLGLVSFSLRAATLIKESTLADTLAKETIEAVRSIRDGEWNKITNGNHGITNISGYWDFSGTENIIDGFTRTILIEDVQRDANDNIVESDGVNDPNTKKVTATVSWKSKKVEIITYLTNWKE